MTHDKNLTLGQIRQSGHGLLNVVCGDEKCGHSVVLDADCWPPSLRLADLESLFVCPVCGHRGADVRLNLAGLSHKRAGESPDRSRGP
jgi:hypothetical protein